MQQIGYDELQQRAGGMPEIMDAVKKAEAHAREELGAKTALLREQVAAHEVLIEAMYDVMRQERADVSRLSPQQASDRGAHRLGCSPADRCAALATALRAYEAELQLKQVSVRAVRVGMPTIELQALLVSWEVQPMLEPVEALRAGLDAQEALVGRVGGGTP